MAEAAKDSGSSAVATREQFQGLDLPAQRILSVSGTQEVERVEQVVVLPSIYQYAINRYPAGQRVMLTSDAYDYINRVMGVQLVQPTYVHDEKGNKQLNPIHRPDYIYLRMVGIWRNDAGQMVSYQEDVEVDFKLTYQDARINAKSMRVLTDNDGMPIFENGSPTPKFTLDADDEKKAMKALSQLRTFGLRYAQTVAKTRILKTASGVRTLPIPQPRDYPIRVVGFRDNLTPEERIARAEAEIGSIFGPTTRVDDEAGLTAEEIASIQDLSVDETEEMERERVEASIEDTANDEPEIIDGASVIAPEARDVTPDGRAPNDQTEWDFSGPEFQGKEPVTATPSKKKSS